MADDVLSLDFVIGLSPTTLVSLGVGDSGGHRVAYATGNIVIVLDSGVNAQTLLRGHVSCGWGGGRGAKRSEARGVAWRESAYRCRR